MSYRHRPIVDTIPGYRQGKPAPALPGVHSYKVSSNENPFGPLPSVTKAIAEHALERINRYPDMRGWEVVSRIADRYGLAPEQVQLGCGSTEVIPPLVSLVAGPGDEVVYPWRSFEAYPIIVAGAGATSVQVPNRPDGSHDVDAMIAAVTDRTRLVILNNPNNPTSASLADEDARRVVAAVPADVIVLFDEAYFQFNTDPDTSVAKDLMHDHPNIVIAHTFSKAYGLAGLRIGYAMGAADVVEGMQKVALPFGVSDVAQQAALASMDVRDELMRRVDDIVVERGRMVAALREQGGTLPEPYGNFFWLELGKRTAEAADRFTAVGLSVRAFPDEGIRISIGERLANDRVLEVCAALRDEGF